MTKIQDMHLVEPPQCVTPFQEGGRKRSHSREQHVCLMFITGSNPLDKSISLFMWIINHP